MFFSRSFWTCLSLTTGLPVLRLAECESFTRLRRATYVACILLIPGWSYGQDVKIPGDVQSIKNEQLELGFDMSRGGAICRLSKRENKLNVINNYDHGRCVQQSYYGDRDGSKWSDKPWRWNPVQGGSCNGKSSKVISSQFSRTKCKVVTQPTHWATGAEIPEAEMSTEATLDGNLAHLVYRFTYTGDRQYGATHQELPAVFADESLDTLVFYHGKSPWTNGEVKRVVPGWPNRSYDVSEQWAAYVNEDDWGLGVYSPRMQHITCYRFPQDGKDEPKGNACSYFAPIENFAIGPKFVFEYEVWLTIGTVNEIRKSFDGVRQSSTLATSADATVKESRR